MMRSLDVIEACIGNGAYAEVTDELRPHVIDVLDVCWLGWSEETRRGACAMLASIGLRGFIPIGDDNAIRDLLTNATNDQLGTALWAIYQNGCLAIRSATRH